MAWDGQERRAAPFHCQTEVLERLTAIEVEGGLLRGLVKEIHAAIYGNSKDGLLVRHDRVEQVVKVGGWLLGGLYLAVIGMLVRRWIG